MVHSAKACLLTCIFSVTAGITNALDEAKDGKMTLVEAKASRSHVEMNVDQSREMSKLRDALSKADAEKRGDLDVAELKAFLRGATFTYGRSLQMTNKMFGRSMFVNIGAFVFLVVMIGWKFCTGRNLPLPCLAWFRRRAPPVL